MIYKKTWLSYLLWAVYACLTGVMLANYAILFWQKKINSVIDYGTTFFVIFVIGTAVGIYLLIRYIFGKIRGKYSMSGHTKFLWEIFIALSIFFTGLLFRISIYLQNINALAETSYYRMAAVRAETAIEPMVHGASYLYTMCLSFVLSFLGNKLTAAVWMQILIQMAAIFLAYFAVRRLAGRIPACAAMLVLSVSSVYAGQVLAATPESLFFMLYLAGMFIVGGYVKHTCQNRAGRLTDFLGALLSGFIIGFLTYLDAIAVTLFIFLPGLITGICREKSGKKQKTAVWKERNIGFSFFLTGVSLAAGGLSFAGMLALHAYSSYTGTGTMAKEWFILYRTHLSADYLFYSTDYSVLECLMLVIPAFWLVMSFWNRPKVQNATPWFLLLFLLAPTPLAATGVLSYQAWSVFLWGVLAGIGVQQTLVWEKSFVRQKAAAEPVMVSEEQPIVESAPIPEETPAAELAFVQEETLPEKPRFLENPLPLPKKHEKRTMDFQYEFEEDMLKFDIEIEDDDDFDIL